MSLTPNPATAPTSGAAGPSFQAAPPGPAARCCCGKPTCGPPPPAERGRGSSLRPAAAGASRCRTAGATGQSPVAGPRQGSVREARTSARRTANGRRRGAPHRGTRATMTDQRAFRSPPPSPSAHYDDSDCPNSPLPTSNPQRPSVRTPNACHELLHAQLAVR